MCCIRYQVVVRKLLAYAILHNPLHSFYGVEVPNVVAAQEFTQMAIQVLSAVRPSKKRLLYWGLIVSALLRVLVLGVAGIELNRPVRC